jgi:cysteine desulfurase
MARVYLDHASLWPLRPEARQAWQDAGDVATGDPARRYAEGRASRDLLERATTATASTLGVGPAGVVWTASGTEAIHLAVLGTARAAERRGDARRHLVVGAVEHSAVLRATERLAEEHGYRLDVVGVDRSGTIDAERMAAAITDRTLAVHLQHANHEVGAVQPTHEVAAVCRARGALLHVDACQSVGQVGLTLEQVGADLLSASCGKFGGPRGLGLLALGERARLAPLLEGDDRQRRRRAGGIDVAAIAAGAVALQAAGAALQAEHSHREVLRRRLRAGLPETADDVEVHGPLADAHPGIVAATARGVDGEALAGALDERGFAVHSGSSCASLPWEEPSHVLIAMGVETRGHVRFSVGPETRTRDVEDLLAAYGDAVAFLRGHLGR